MEFFFNYNNEETFFRIAQKNKSSKIKGQNDWKQERQKDGSVINK